MKLGLIGLGKMGINLALNLAEQDFTVIGYDIDKEVTTKNYHPNIHCTNHLKTFSSQLSQRKIIWLMVPAGEITKQMIEQITPELQPGDIIIDGGNSNYQQTIETGKQLSSKGIHFFDCGTSGGVSGARNGACLMIGGEEEVFHEIEPIIKALALPNGYLYTG